jgi:hypothetical protein
MWSSENPHFFIETPQYPQKVGVWAAISQRRIIGPIFFEGCDQKLASDSSGLSGGFRGIGCGFTKWKMGARQLLFELVVKLVQLPGQVLSIL